MVQPQEPAQSPGDASDEIVIEPDDFVVDEAATGEAPVATAKLTDERAESPFAGERVIYVESPLPPKEHSNRAVGVALAFLGAVVFAFLFAAAGAAFIAVTAPTLTFGDFITDAVYWIPVLLFTVGFVFVAALLNRAAWWGHVLGSLLVAIFTYLGSIGVLLLVTGIAGSSPGFVATALSPYVLAATIVAREVSIWVGLLIARRGVKVTARNKAEREAFEAEQAGARGGKSPDGAASAAS